jgi:hypothetical protein
MAIKPDAFVCKPSLTINRERLATMLHFELMDPDTRQSLGKPYNVAMTTADAMRLLWLLETIQRKYNLPKHAGEPEHIHIPPQKEQS